MPFRCKCGRTFEKVESFGSHTSGCAPFHHKRTSSYNSDLKNAMKKQEEERKKLSIETSFEQPVKGFSFLSPTNNKTEYFFGGFLNPSKSSQQESPLRSAPIFEGERFSFMMPTALSIQNTFEGVQRKRSMSYSSSSPANVAFK